MPATTLAARPLGQSRRASRGEPFCGPLFGRILDSDPSRRSLPGFDRPAEPARIDDYADVGGRLAGGVGKTGIRSAAGAAIIVNGEFWGVMATRSTE